MQIRDKVLCGGLCHEQIMTRNHALEFRQWKWSRKMKEILYSFNHQSIGKIKIGCSVNLFLDAGTLLIHLQISPKLKWIKSWHDELWVITEALRWQAIFENTVPLYPKARPTANRISWLCREIVSNKSFNFILRSPQWNVNVTNPKIGKMFCCSGNVLQISKWPLFPSEWWFDLSKF